ncbi:PqiC family protein [Agaribacter flavus]|uniref:Membrane integrity-associated transporter subunit PqiC n=1 Tax=Agaribacter flavus TaxID=1902781 RepID=A0ABV7FRX6_9ALTE
MNKPTNASLLPSLILLATIFCGLAACSSAPSSDLQQHYYVFDANPLPQVNRIPDNANVIEIRSVKLPRYLNGDQLVMQAKDHRFIKANYHSWADNLHAAIKRALINDINQLEGKYFAVNSCENCKQLSVYIEHFYPSEEGLLLLSGYLAVTQPNGVSSIRHFYNKSQLREAGYANAVKQMREQIRVLASEINQTP